MISFHFKVTHEISRNVEHLTLKGKDSRSDQVWGIFQSVAINYRQTYDISRTKSQNLNVSRPVLQVLSRELRCRWSSADSRCFNYIWLINNFIAY